MITQLKLIPVVNGEHPFAAAAENAGLLPLDMWRMNIS